MGFNSVILILNDRLSEIERDEKFGDKVGTQLGMHCTNHHHKHCSGGFSVVAQHHADNTSIILVGGNTHKVIDIVRKGHDWCMDGEEGEAGIIDVLKEVANDYGYKLTKMTAKEKQNNSWREPYKGHGWAM